MILKALLIAMTTAAISFLLSHAEMFVGLRVWLRKHMEFLGRLIDCCYCLGHWIAVPFIILMPVALFGIFWPLDYLLTWLTISWLAGMLSMLTVRLWGE